MFSQSGSSLLIPFAGWRRSRSYWEFGVFASSYRPFVRLASSNALVQHDRGQIDGRPDATCGFHQCFCDRGIRSLYLSNRRSSKHGARALGKLVYSASLSPA